MNWLTGLSLPLCAAIGAMWVRSYFVGDNLRWNAGHLHTRQLSSSAGAIWFVDRRGPAAEAAYDQAVRKSLHGPSPLWAVSHQHWMALEAAMETDADGRDITYYAAWDQYGVRDWVLTGLTMLMPLAWCSRRLRHRRSVKAGLCAACGYDLRATPDRCPECGTPVATKEEA